MTRAIATIPLVASIFAISANAEPADEDPFGLKNEPAIEVADTSVHPAIESLVLRHTKKD